MLLELRQRVGSGLVVLGGLRPLCLSLGHGVARSCEANPPPWMSEADTAVQGWQPGWWACFRVRAASCRRGDSLLRACALPTSQPCPSAIWWAFVFKFLCPFRKTSLASSTRPVPSATQATGMSSPSGPSAASPACTPTAPSRATRESRPVGACSGGGGPNTPVPMPQTPHFQSESQDRAWVERGGGLDT